jgi:integrase
LSYNKNGFAYLFWEAGFMKHFVTVNAPSYRSERYLLLTSEGKEFKPFMMTMKNLSRQGYAINTIEQYAGHIARFIDYIYEAAEHISEVSAENIIEAVYSYKNYLLFGVDASDDLAKKIALKLRPNKTTNGASLIPIGAAIKYFLTLSDVKALANDEETLFERISLPKKKTLTKNEIIQLKKHSMLAGVIRGGAQFTKKTNELFGRKNQPSNEFRRVEMPFDKVEDLINATNSYRDKVFYSLLAASGCRQHEALQIRLSDIDFEEREVQLIDPFSRDNEGLTQSEYEKLSWKGRATTETFLIKPFKTQFFNNLECYIREERIAHGLHDFVLQDRSGRPYLCTTRQTRSQVFNSLKNKINLQGRRDITIHSIRHMYGCYTLNYLPISDRFGLPMSIVKVLMGHSSIKSTELYARQDKDRIKAEIEFANQMIFGLEGSLSFDEIKLRYHKGEIERLVKIKTNAIR